MTSLRTLCTLILFAFAAQTPAALAGDGCRYPFVWREAFEGDHVCVTPNVRARAVTDNRAAPDRVNQNNHDYGPDTCNYPFVWREARPSDHVCVTPDIRSQAARDNAEAGGRYAAAFRAPSGRGQGGGSGASCCPNSMLVCPLGRHFCR